VACHLRIARQSCELPRNAAQRLEAKRRSNEINSKWRIRLLTVSTRKADIGCVGNERLIGVSQQQDRMMRPFRQLHQYIPVIVLLLMFLGVWHTAVTVLQIPEYILPSPMAVAIATFGGDIRWVRHIEVTSAEIVLGFVISGVVGVLLGVMIAWTAVIERTLVPFLVFINILPKVAIAPLFLLWLGYGIFPNAVIAASIGFFPVVINTAVGLSQTPEEMLDLGKVFGAPKWKIFLKIRIPGALPYIVSALKVSATSCVVGAIVGEFVASQRGLGSVIINTQSTMNTAVGFAAIVWISVLGLALYGFVSLGGKWLAPWADRSPT
jgi:NitT/TauT family transport system permease protein